MSRLSRTLRCAAVVGVIGSFTLTTSIQAAPSRHLINAKQAGQDLGGGVTTADIIGGGLLQGRSDATFVVTGISGSVVFLAGDVIFTTHQGTLTVSVTGSFDLATGEFSASSPVTGATGKLAGATGSLSFVGVEDLTNGSFTSEMSGEIVVDLAPGS